MATCSYEFVTNASSIISKVNVFLTPLHIPRNQENGRFLAHTSFHSTELKSDQYISYTSEVAAVQAIDNLQLLLTRKKKLVSFVLDFRKIGEMIPLHWNKVLKQIPKSDVFVISRGMSVKDRLAVYDNAFKEYRFSMILDDGGYSVCEPLLHAISQHTVPVYNGFFEMSTMFANGVVGWDEVFFTYSDLEKRLRELNKQIRFLWSYQQILQEIVTYRFHAPVESRLRYFGTWLCLTRALPLAVVGIYSKLENHELRNAIRSTWGAELKILKIEVLFFISSITHEYTTIDDSFDDIIYLPLSDGYRNNSKKGVLFLNWIYTHKKQFKFLIKTDDDIYFQPRPLLEGLHNKIPAGYVWGFIDYISPVPRTVGELFFNSLAVYPFNTFPTYPRGVVRVLSMDLVGAISQQFQLNKLRMIYGDDPNLGVHLRQLVVGNIVPSITIDDSGSYTRFAMVPSCAKQGWSTITNNTWIVHHVNPEQIKCMWKMSLEQTDTTPSICKCV